MKKTFFFAIPVILILVSILVFRNGSSPENNQPPKKLYISLGDSVPAGLGLFTASDSSACDRTNESYPNVLAQKKDYEVRNIACSGATIQNGILGPQNVNQLDVPAQISQLDSNEKPALLTLTVGANDVGWIEPIINCFTSACGTPEQTQEITTRIEQLKVDLSEVLERINQLYTQNPPKTLVTGYYQLFSDSATDCLIYDSVTDTERVWLDNRLEDINTAIKQTTANYNYVTYASLDFSEHTLCSDNPWVQGISESAPFHPTEDGQKAIAGTLASYLD